MRRSPARIPFRRSTSIRRARITSCDVLLVLECDASSMCPRFTYMADARAVDHFLAMPLGRWGHDVYNLGGECTMSILEAAKRVASVCGRIYPGGQIPVVAGEDPAECEGHRPFRYSIDKLRSTGFSLESEMDREIEKTLRMCVETAEVVGG